MQNYGVHFSCRSSTDGAFFYSIWALAPYLASLLHSMYFLAVVPSSGVALGLFFGSWNVGETINIYHEINNYTWG